MSLDVSPDGQEIAFDLLGDIYVMPISGGEARPLLTGHAWEMQPRYSPSGSEIAFTSDRGGGDNIWTMDRSGQNLRQITKEDFRLLNQAEEESAQAKRTALYEEANRKIMEFLPGVPYVHAKAALALESDVTGYVPSPVGVGGESFATVGFGEAEEEG